MRATWEYCWQMSDYLPACLGAGYKPIGLPAQIPAIWQIAGHSQSGRKEAGNVNDQFSRRRSENLERAIAAQTYRDVTIEHRSRLVI